MPLPLQVLAAALLLLCGAFVLLAAIGLLRFDDFYMRLHAPTLASTLGIGCGLLASVVIGWFTGQVGWNVLLLALFVFVTAPVGVNLMAMAALHLKLPSRAPVPSDQPGD